VRRYKVSFDGQCQAEFDDLEQALDWGREVGKTGRMVHVVEHSLIRFPKLIAVFPQNQAEFGRRAWWPRGGTGDGGCGPYY
jgi:hypothetical protein